MLAWNSLTELSAHSFFPKGYLLSVFHSYFDGSGKSVQTINKALLEHGIFGGHDVSPAFPELGQCALYSFTEVHSQDDVATLCEALASVLMK